MQLSLWVLVHMNKHKNMEYPTKFIMKVTTRGRVIPRNLQLYWKHALDILSFVLVCPGQTMVGK